MPTPAGSVEDRRTARLRLRRVDADSADAVVALHVDPANYPFGPDGARSPAQARALTDAFIEHWHRDGIGYWVVERDGQVIGIAGITPTPLAGRPCWNLYYRFAPSARGQGYAAEVCREAIAVGAQLAPGRPVVVRTRPGNAPARRLATALGLVRRADLDDDGFVAYLSPQGFPR